MVTPAARDFLRGKGIQVQIEGDGLMDLNKSNYSTTRQSIISISPNISPRAIPQEQPDAGDAAPSTRQFKPEHMTSLYQDTMVSKNHPVIALRGQLDLFQCEVIQAQFFFQESNEPELVQQLEEILELSRQLMSAEVRQEPYNFTTLIGYAAEELREVSNHPQKYLGVQHATKMSISQGPVVARLNLLRAKSRVVELCANRAFTDERGNCCRTDIIMALNRLSSALYIMACRARAREETGDQPESARH